MSARRLRRIAEELDIPLRGKKRMHILGQRTDREAHEVLLMRAERLPQEKPGGSSRTARANTLRTRRR